jgi:photosynthetic reaction center cytochrome c subunit
MKAWIILTTLMLASGAFVFAGGFERPPMETVQRGYRGLGMEEVENPRQLAAKLTANQLPEPVPAIENSGTKASEVYSNVQVLGDLDEAQFTRLMAAMTEWVSPEQGCNYCHTEDGDFASDGIYTKVVARRMLQMTQHLNSSWKTHVGATGVNCYTCHRGQPVPTNIWFTDPGRPHAQGMAGNPAGQNAPAPGVGLASLPNDPFTPFLAEANNIRVVSTTEVPGINRQSIKQTEWTYGLMMHMSNALGVNCTYCHNTRSFMSWDQSNPARTTAWYGIRMLRDVNANYLEPLKPTFPHGRLGPLGDAPKANCTTCHQGAYKPLYGASMLADYPELGPSGQAGTTPAPQ